VYLTHLSSLIKLALLRLPPLSDRPTQLEDLLLETHWLGVDPEVEWFLLLNYQPPAEPLPRAIISLAKRPVDSVVCGPTDSEEEHRGTCTTKVANYKEIFI
jgi:hypothetical protein